MENKKPKNHLLKKAIRSLGRFAYSHYKEDASERLLYKIKSANSKDDILSALQDTKSWEDIRWEGGRNILHMIAQYAPRFFSDFAQLQSTSLLQNTKNEKNMYPLEYFLCFANPSIVSRNRVLISDLVKDGKLPKPDWLEIKILVAENHVTYSGVDSLASPVWKRYDNPGVFEILKSERGQKLIEMVANNFTYKRKKIVDQNDTSISYDDVYYGMELDEYTLRPYEEHGIFFSSAETENEVKVSLMQTWREFYRYGASSQSCYDYYKRFEHASKNVELLTTKAIEMGINVVEMKREIMASFDNKRDALFFNEYMSENLKSWDNLLPMFERRKLEKAISSKCEPQRDNGIGPTL